MARSTIQDVAKMSGLSVSTVNRALHQPNSVRAETLEAILQAAETVNFYGIGSIRNSILSNRPKLRIGILLMQRNRAFYKSMADAFKKAAQTSRDHDIIIDIDYQDELSPQNVSEGLHRLAAKADVIGVVAPEHPIVGATIDRLAESGKKFFGIISPQTAQCGVGYVGLNAWKVGRTAGWAIDNFCKNKSSKIGVLVGNHRFRSQEANESGFRSYLREHANTLVLLEPQSTFENSNISQEITEEMLQKHPDLSGLFVCGGGISGVIAALRNSGRANDIFTVGYDLTDVTREALLDGTLNFLISHPLNLLAEETIDAMIRAKRFGAEVPPQSIQLPFEIYTSENL